MSLTQDRQEINVRLLGRFSVDVAGTPVEGFENRRPRELLAYLVINRDRRIARDVVAETLWPTSRGEARKNLRQVLWQLHSRLDPAADAPVIVSNGSVVGIDPTAPLRADIARLELAQQRMRDEPARVLSDDLAALLEDVSVGCSGDLLQGCYEDWCLVERERYRAIQFNALDRLVANAEATGNLALGIEFAEMLLRRDVASERTHVRLMTMRYRNGDRTGALRQFQTCARELRRELDVEPAPTAIAVNELVRACRPLPDDPRPGPADDPRAAIDLLRELHQAVGSAAELLDRTMVALGIEEAAARRREDG